MTLCYIRRFHLPPAWFAFALVLRFVPPVFHNCGKHCGKHSRAAELLPGLRNIRCFREAKVSTARKFGLPRRTNRHATADGATLVWAKVPRSRFFG